MRIYVNKVENRIKFKIKTGCYISTNYLEALKIK